MSSKNLPEVRRREDGIAYFPWDLVMVNSQEHQQYVIQMHFVQRGELYVELAKRYVQPLHEPGDILSLSEKITSICQDNTVEKKNVKIDFWVRSLSKFASSNNRGIAMDEPYKFQLAINLAGSLRVLLASFCSVVTKLFGIHGVPYKIAGHGIDGIDGPYMSSSFKPYYDPTLPSSKEPVRVCNDIQQELDIGCLLVGANDLSVVISRKSDTLISVPGQDLIAMIKDNPAG